MMLFPDAYGFQFMVLIKVLLIFINHCTALSLFENDVIIDNLFNNSFCLFICIAFIVLMYKTDKQNKC